MTGAAMQTNQTLTAVEGIKVGHHTLTTRPTGCTVIIAEAGAVAGVDVRGAAPGTRETDLLNPVNTVQQVHAIVLSGGSAFGLAAADGTMRYLDEKGIGFPIGGGVVPIVTSAILYDLNVGDRKIRPDAACGYEAARAATNAPVAEGNVGAGAGATVGKLTRDGKAMKGGLGSAALALPNGLVVAALVAVNAVGNVVDPATGRTIAGARTADGKGFVDLRAMLRGATGGAIEPRPLENTTLAVVATNAQLTKVQATRIAQRAHDGYARAIYPSHTSFDGDAIFALSTGTWKTQADADHIGSLAADAIAEAIVRAVRAATSIPGYPAARDLNK
ncbi:MAG: peptidase S58 [Acidobacteria bacterium RIFCSPLOWO2_02_FULL_67_36]|nr:MAG: peptidase S58 [Acidobacteria bacterium RIFCSPLOWO2_02_FULL_67_36]OFW23408.1 MAG: peptidase S58 [Acidobacteria bacterium RIFCSPLOWO2_12_FULL_66_21]